MSYQALWVRFFVVTVLIEMAVALPLLARSTPTSAASEWGTWPRRVLVVLIANFATHPFVWFVLARLGWSRLWLTLVGEAWAVGFETVVYALAIPLPRSRALAVSALANGASFTLGHLAGNLM